MANLTQEQLAALIANVVSQVMQGQSAAPKAASAKFLPKGAKAAPVDLASKDAAIVNAFHRKGFKDVQLMDRSNPKAAFNVKPFKAWLAEGRIVRRGQRGVRGLFHITQTDALPVKAAPSAKSTVTAEQKELFARGKAAFKAKKAKSQPSPAH